jgi:hypothetical protein
LRCRNAGQRVTRLHGVQEVSFFQPGRIVGRSDLLEGVPAPARRLDRRSRHCARPVSCSAPMA